MRRKRSLVSKSCGDVTKKEELKNSNKKKKKKLKKKRYD